MRKLVVALACATLVAPAAAAAKGPSAATVQGDGLDGGGMGFTSGRGGDPSSGSPLARLTEGAGLFPAVFGQTPSPMEPGRPKGDLGPRYTITYTVPGGSGTVFRIRQDLYPYAAGGAVTYTAPGQPIFDSKTAGGWFLALPDLKPLLVEHGLPATRPAGSGGSGYALSWPAAGLSVLLVALLGGLALVALRRRPGPLATR